MDFGKGRNRGKKKNDSVIFELVWCILIYIAGIFSLVIFKAYIFSLALFFVATLFIIPTLIEAKKEYDEFIKRYKKRIRKIKTVIIGGLPSKKKKHKEITITKEITKGVFSHFSPEKAHAKGEVMREFGLFYDNKPQGEKIDEDKKEGVKEVEKHSLERMTKFDVLFSELEAFGKIRFSYQAHVGKFRGADIGKFVLIEAKRRGLSNVSVKQKGKDIIISMPKSTEKK